MPVDLHTVVNWLVVKMEIKLFKFSVAKEICYFEILLWLATNLEKLIFNSFTFNKRRSNLFSK